MGYVVQNDKVGRNQIGYCRDACGESGRKATYLSLFEVCLLPYESGIHSSIPDFPNLCWWQLSDIGSNLSSLSVGLRVMTYSSQWPEIPRCHPQVNFPFLLVIPVSFHHANIWLLKPRKFLQIGGAWWSQMPGSSLFSSRRKWDIACVVMFYWLVTLWTWQWRKNYDQRLCKTLMPMINITNICSTRFGCNQLQFLL